MNTNRIVIGSIVFLVVFIIVALIVNNRTVKGNPINQAESSSGNGSFYFKNTQSDPYDIYLDGMQVGTLQPQTTSKEFVVEADVVHEVKAVQISGYYFYPSSVSNTFVGNSKYSGTWVI